jgi:hypothetical protein
LSCCSASEETCGVPHSSSHRAGGEADTWLHRPPQHTHKHIDVIF